jgi:hypothetical protein
VPGAAGRDLLDEWSAGTACQQSLQGVARIRVQTPERTASGTQVLLTEAPDRLRTEILSPFGTPLLIMAANGTDLGVLLPGDNLFYHGRATPENLGRFTRLPLRLAELVAILLARPPLIDYRELQAYLLADGGWRLELTAGPRHQVLGFDPARRLIDVRYLYGEEMQLHLTYGESGTEACGLARRIDLSLPLQQTSASLSFTEMTVNRQLPPELFSLSPPAGAQVVNLDEVITKGATAGGKVETPDPARPQQEQP